MFEAKDVMTEHVLSVDQHTKVEGVIALLLRHHLSGLPVVDGENKPIGIISEYDLLPLMYDLEGLDQEVGELMSSTPRTIPMDRSLTDVVDTFRSESFRRLPVVDPEGQLVGILSRRDLIRFIHKVRLRVGEELQAVHGLS